MLREKLLTFCIEKSSLHERLFRCFSQLFITACCHVEHLLFRVYLTEAITWLSKINIRVVFSLCCFMGYGKKPASETVVDQRTTFLRTYAFLITPYKIIFFRLQKWMSIKNYIWVNLDSKQFRTEAQKKICNPMGNKSLLYFSLLVPPVTF